MDVNMEGKRGQNRKHIDMIDDLLDERYGDLKRRA